jgi:hypothetical protein
MQSVLLASALLAISGAASASPITCLRQLGCVPAAFTCGHAEHFGGAGIAFDNPAQQSLDDCSNSLVISPDAAAAAFSESSPRADAPSFVQESKMWAAAGSSYVESAGSGQPPQEGDEGQPYVPLTAQQKFQIFVRSTHDPATFVNAGLDSLLSQASGDFRGYGGGMQGFGKRLGATLADSESGVFFDRFLFPVLYRQDPRFRRLGHGTLIQRAWHAASHVFITKGDNGADQINYAHILGRFTSKALSNIYYPANQRGLGRTMRRTANGLVSDAGSYMFKEFWPDLRQKLIPKRFQRTADRLSAIDRP